jgi:hypothetical protein
MAYVEDYSDWTVSELVEEIKNLQEDIKDLKDHIKELKDHTKFTKIKLNGVMKNWVLSSQVLPKCWCDPQHNPKFKEHGVHTEHCQILREFFLFPPKED